MKILKAVDEYEFFKTHIKFESAIQKLMEKGVKSLVFHQDVDFDRLAHLWYGGNILSFEIDEFKVVIGTQGNTICTLMDVSKYPHITPLAKVNDRSNSGEFMHVMARFIQSDIEFDEIYKEEHDELFMHAEAYNQFVCKVYDIDTNELVDTFTSFADFLPEAVDEFIEEIFEDLYSDFSEDEVMELVEDHVNKVMDEIFGLSQMPVPVKKAPLPFLIPMDGNVIDFTTILKAIQEQKRD